MVSTAIEKVLGVTEREYEGTLIRLGAPWQRMTYRDALLEYGGVDPLEADLEELRRRIFPVRS
jgi:lysyl-tRNA synthetase class II